MSIAVVHSQRQTKQQSFVGGSLELLMELDYNSPFARLHLRVWESEAERSCVDGGVYSVGIV